MANDLKTTRNRQSRRKDAIHFSLRDQIVRGEFLPGGKLPAFAELERQFGAAERTIERAIQQLCVEGFVRVKSKVGTFVVDHPPHLWKYGLVFHDHPVEEPEGEWSRFYRALLQEAERVNALGGPRTIRCYYDCSGHADSEGYQELLRDLAGRRLVGLMFPFIPDHTLAGQAPMEMPGIFRVTTNTDCGAIPIIGLDPLTWMDKALDHLAARGRSRIALITRPTQTPTLVTNFQHGLMRRRMSTLPHWIYPVHSGIPFWMSHAVYAIMRSGNTPPPDGLILADDHLAKYVGAALAELNVRAPEELDLITHWNFPLDDRPRVPMTKLGYDAGEFLSRWMDSIDAQRRGERVPARTVVTPVFEEEWMARPRATFSPSSVSIA